MTDFTLILMLNIFYFFLMFKFFQLEKRMEKHHIILQWILWFLILMVLNVVGCILVREDGLLEVICMALVLGILTGVVVFVTFLEHTIEKEEQLKQQMIQQQEDYQKHHLQEVEREQMYIRKLRHEMKNLFVTIESMAEKGDCEGILTLVRERQGQILPAKGKVKTGNIAVDTILNYKLPKMETFGITATMNLNIPTKLNVDDIVLVGVLGNAIDNAVEASRKLPQEERKIIINMNVEKKNLFIEVINRYDGFIVTSRNGEILTRKGKKSNHGFGLPVVRQLIEQCNGNLDVSWDKTHFYLRAMMYHVL